jgi:hypothetical protein
LAVLLTAGGLSVSLEALDALSPAPAAASPSDDYQAQILADAPVSYWRLNDSGLTADDQLDVADGGIASSGVTKGTAGILGDSAMSFDGDSGYISLPTIAALQPSAAITVEAWVRTSTTTAPHGRRVVVRSRSFGYELEISSEFVPIFANYSLDGTPHYA